MHWLVVRTHPNSEKIAIKNLERQEFDYYQPLILERKIRRQQLTHVEQPLFPCYLFVQIVDRWRSLQSTYGVVDLLGPVRDHIIVDLRNREQNGYIQLPKPKQFVNGDKVIINAGAFAGQTALVERMPIKERQKILLALLSNKIHVLCDESELEAA